MHVLWEVASAILLIIPLFAVGQAYRQTRSPRLLFAFLAFAVLELRFGVAVAIHSVIVVDHTFEETVGFLTDLIAIALFAAAFLCDGVASWESRCRPRVNASSPWSRPSPGCICGSFRAGLAFPSARCDTIWRTSRNTTWWLRIAAAASRGGFRLAHSRRTTEL